MDGKRDVILHLNKGAALPNEERAFVAVVSHQASLQNLGNHAMVVGGIQQSLPNDIWRRIDNLPAASTHELQGALALRHAPHHQFALVQLPALLGREVRLAEALSLGRGGWPHKPDCRISHGQQHGNRENWQKAREEQLQEVPLNFIVTHDYHSRQAFFCRNALCERPLLPTVRFGMLGPMTTETAVKTTARRWCRNPLWLAAALAPAAVWLTGCGASAEHTAATTPRPSADGPGDQRVAATSNATSVGPDADRRDLPAEATFGALVAAANALDQRHDHNSTSQCLLRGSGAPDAAWRLEADLAAAVRPLPEPPENLEELLKNAPGPVHVLSRWGRVGRQPYGPVLVAFTTTTPSSGRLDAVALLLAEAGTFVRQSGSPGEKDGKEAPLANTTPLPMDALGPMLAKRAAQGPFAIYVTAESGVTLARLRELLWQLPYGKHEVALAVPLAPGTRLPAERSASAGDAHLWCPNGLPEPPEDKVEGELTAQGILQATGPLRKGAQGCLSSAVGPAAAGGRVNLAIRIGADGGTETACLLNAEVRDPGLARCLVQTARSLRFPTPEPRGFVDAHLPLKLEPQGFSPQRPVCE